MNLSRGGYPSVRELHLVREIRSDRAFFEEYDGMSVGPEPGFNTGFSGGSSMRTGAAWIQPAASRTAIPAVNFRFDLMT